MTDDLLERGRQTVREVMGPHESPAEIGPDTPLTDGGPWLDSVQRFEVLLACEREFGRVFEGRWDSITASFQTVGTLAAAIRARLEQSKSSAVATSTEEPAR